MELFFVLITLALVPLVVSSIVPTVSFIRQKMKSNESSPSKNRFTYEYTFSSDLVNQDLEDSYDSSSADMAIPLNSARNQEWIRGLVHVMSAEEFEQKRAQEFNLQLP